jgi:hypothetical protein
MEFLYSDSDGYHFMNTETFDQVALNAEALGDSVKYLVSNLKVEVEFHELAAVGVTLPKTVDMRVIETEPGLKGATANNSLKPATVETGAIVQVPGFITAGGHPRRQKPAVSIARQIDPPSNDQPHKGLRDAHRGSKPALQRLPSPPAALLPRSPSRQNA